MNIFGMITDVFNRIAQARKPSFNLSAGNAQVPTGEGIWRPLEDDGAATGGEAGGGAAAAGGEAAAAEEIAVAAAEVAA